MDDKVEIEIGGKKRELKFGTLAIMSAEKALGVNAMSGELFSQLSLNSIIVLTWAALLHSNKKLTIEQVAEWIPFSDINGEFSTQLMNALFRAYLLGRGDSPEEVEKKMLEISPEQKAAE